MQEKVSIICSWCGLENPSRGRSAAQGVTRLAESPPCCTKPEEHMKDTYILAYGTSISA